MAMAFPCGPEGLPAPDEVTEDGWMPWRPWPEIAARFDVTAEGRGGERALVTHGNGDAACLGAWRRSQDVVPGRNYRFTACHRAEGVSNQDRCIWARLDWRDAQGERIRQPDLVSKGGQEGGWTRHEGVFAAPDDACRVLLELSLATGQGSVWWSDVALTEEAPGPERLVRAATLHFRPRNTASPAESVAEFCRLAETAAPLRPDILCLPEAITLIGTGWEFRDVSETIPGPTTEALGSVARSLHSYVVAGIAERVGAAVYNTAVLLGRDGAVVGKYRKTHLPREEVEMGLTPGDEYPVFLTDFGTVGIMICWDLQFPEPARALALRGAEILLLPIWGGSETLARARAIENHVFLVSSTYDMRSYVVDPSGQVLAEAMDENPIAVAELALDRPILQPWIGNMKARTWKERRGDIAVEVGPEARP